MRGGAIVHLRNGLPDAKWTIAQPLIKMQDSQTMIIFYSLTTVGIILTMFFKKHFALYLGLDTYAVVLDGRFHHFQIESLIKTTGPINPLQK